HRAADQHIMEMSDDEVGVVKLQIERHRGNDDAGETADYKCDDEANHIEHRHLEARATIPHGRKPAEDLQACRNGHCHACRRVKAVADARQAGREHMMDPQAEGEDPGGDEREDYHRISEYWTPAEGLDQHADET